MQKFNRKILLLADAYSNHTFKWATALSEQGFEICIFSLSQQDIHLYDNVKNIKVVYNTFSKNLFQKPSSNILKLQYLTAMLRLKRTIKQFQPDIVHAHYASSYGLLGVLLHFQPLIISVWGSDVFEFPLKSAFHKKVLQYNLKHAGYIFATSLALAVEAKKYTHKPIEVTPFGIDTNVFKPFEVKSLFDKNDVVIGTIKSLETVYGIDYLIKAFNILRLKHPGLPLRLLIAGSGSKEWQLKALANDLNLGSIVIFTGRIKFEDLPDYHNMITIFAALSLSESFGVAVLESSACGKPVVVSDVGGLPEIVEHNITGLIVPPANESEAAEAFEKLILDKRLQFELGMNGRNKVKANFNWNDNVKKMVELYKKVLSLNSPN